MLGSFKRFFSKPVAGTDYAHVSEWAQRRGLGFKRARDDEGFVVDGLLEGKPWRLEWGPSQRAYIEGRELRLRMEVALPSDMQMLLLSRTLMTQLERQTYEQFTESTQTQIGTSTPEEMRWLVMFSKVNLAGLPDLRANFGAVASTPASGLAWIEGPLSNILQSARTALLAADPPFLLMTLRNRAYLRMLLPTPEVGSLAAALDIFETAVAQARRSAITHVDTGPEWNSTAASAWESMKPDESAAPRRR